MTFHNMSLLLEPDTKAVQYNPSEIHDSLFRDDSHNFFYNEMDWFSVSAIFITWTHLQ